MPKLEKEKKKSIDLYNLASHQLMEKNKRKIQLKNLRMSFCLARHVKCVEPSMYYSWGVKK